MRFEIDHRDQFSILTPLEERLDSSVAPTLKAEFVVLLTEGVENLIVDLSHVRYVDSSGLSALLLAHRHFAGQGGFFALAGAQEPVLRLIQVSLLDTVFLLYPTLEEAIEACYVALLDRGEEADQENGDSGIAEGL
ncbi:MAG: STAS domain-containing protein [Bacteroidetes bacterium]|nr:STAS domain-containing protein [Rhodothermia bacterium]MCS7155422.1 STAS domain-containing protein [Bacteroidota bacterium]MCX7907485.1 STAS domain-containing protein [Bacteroidota bacterium]MDW8138479.1 STAS domain-containing protein [Bacteroidota bacterium]MDW8284584.1 STAS domain-containing protein [Bacteroidota bacterium]